MKNLDEKIVRRAVNYDNLESTARYLEKMAQDGWMLEKISATTRFHFVKSEPRKLRFAVEIFPDGSEFDTHTTDSNLEYVEFCRKAGWNFICSAGKLNYFYTEDESIPEIESDQKIKLKTIKKAQRPMKIIFPIYFLCMSIIFFSMQFTVNLNVLETSFFMFSAILLMGFAAILQMFILISYLAWLGRAEKAVKLGEKIPPNKNNLTIHSGYIFLLIFGVLHSAIVVLVGMQYQEKIVFLIPCLWIFIFLLILLMLIVTSFAEKKKIGRKWHKAIIMGFIPLCVTAILIGIIVFVVRNTHLDNNDRHLIDGMDLNVFGDSNTFVRREASNVNWGRFLLSYNRYTIVAHNADREKMLEDDGYQKTGVYMIPDGEDCVPVTYSWRFDIYQTKNTIIYNRILREAKEGKTYRTLGIRFDFDKAVRMPELEVNGITVWSIERANTEEWAHSYLIIGKDCIIKAMCDEALNVSEMEVIYKSFIRRQENP